MSRRDDDGSLFSQEATPSIIIIVNVVLFLQIDDYVFCMVVIILFGHKVSV